jgi:thymidylate synthase (FAD)
VSVTLDEHGRPVADVLDHGYVRLLGVMRYFSSNDHEVAVVNAARASFDKYVTEVGSRDVRLINFLVDRAEDSPLRHSFLSFGVKAPLMVARQWWKYAVGSAHLVEGDATAWNERTFRAAAEPEFYVPPSDGWRSASPYNKQGSSEPIGKVVGEVFSGFLTQDQESATANYSRALEAGVAPEQARLFLPAYGLYVSWVWSVSLLGVLHFLDQRLHEKAQAEITAYAQPVRKIVADRFPHVVAAVGL